MTNELGPEEPLEPCGVLRCGFIETVVHHCGSIFDPRVPPRRDEADVVSASAIGR
jgi:hypothetical protein